MVDASAELSKGRDAFARSAWAEARAALAAADGEASLEGSDLELLANATYMLGEEGESLGLLERAHRAHLDRGEPLAAVRCAFWIGVTLASHGEIAQAGGWLGRARRILEREGGDRVEAGYLLLPTVFEQEARGELERAAETAAEAISFGERFEDPELFALAAQQRGYLLIQAGRLQEGLGLLDEAMVGVVAGELSPRVSGIVYCGVILACQEAHEPRRAREWTDALARWCDAQPDLVAFTGRCLVHRAEIMQLQGSLSEGLEEARRGERRCLEGGNPGAAAEARYRQGEIHRLRGELGAAEEAYLDAGARGREPQPGLALLRLAQGREADAAAAIRRALAEDSRPGARLALLPAAVEVMLATESLGEAATACEELERAAAESESPMLEAMAATARGAVSLARGDATAALGPLRHGVELWLGLEAAYEAARTRQLVAEACRELGDEDGAALELQAGESELERLGAAAAGGTGPRGEGGLTDRELEVLRLVAAGMSNRDVAGELVISEHTVARHVQNIFAKLGVSSRTAASARARELGLI